VSPVVIACIVEGDGDREAVPSLLRRLRDDIVIQTPVKAKRQQVVLASQLERFAAIADSNVSDGGGKGAVLLILDADRDCPATLGPELRDRLRARLPHRPVGCVFAVREFESWIVAGHSDASTAADERRESKAWLRNRYGRYVETVDQKKLTSKFDLELAVSASRSLRHLSATLDRLIAEAEGTGTQTPLIG